MLSSFIKGVRGLASACGGVVRPDRNLNLSSFRPFAEKVHE